MKRKRFKILVSHKDEEDWINIGINKDKKRKRVYIILEYYKDVEDPVKWARKLIAHFNTTLPKERHRKFHFIKKERSVE